MAVTRTESNVFYGFADIWYAAENTAAPTSVASMQDPGAAGYTSVGFTSDGVELDVAKTMQDITVEEQLTAVDTVVTSVDITVKFAIAEDLLANRQLAMGIGTNVNTARNAGVQIGKNTLTLGSSLTKKALVIDVTNVFGLITRLYIPSVAAVGSVNTQFKRVEKRVYPVEFRALCAETLITITEANQAA